MTPAEAQTSRFATVAEALSDEFRKIHGVLHAINAELNLPDHSDLNAPFYPWSSGLYPPPQIYATRLWEYPFAVTAADLRKGMSCADIGCGMTPFTVFLMRLCGCKVTGFDPDLYASGFRYKAFGVSREFIGRTGLRVLPSPMQHLDAEESAFDRVFCISVLEHVSEAIARRGVQEIARVLKPGGLAILTLDVNIFSTLCEADPLSLVWDSGLVPAGAMDLRWPRRRLGVFCKGNEPADVFGLVLRKEEYEIETAYAGVGGVSVPDRMPGYKVPAVRKPKEKPLTILPWRTRLKRALLLILRGHTGGRWTEP